MALINTCLATIIYRWQEDENAEGGHRKAMDRLPSNPEVENIMILRMVM